MKSAVAKKGASIGFLGAGRMATALAEGMVRRGVVAGADIIACDSSDEARDRFSTAIAGARTISSSDQFSSDLHTLILAVKPQKFLDATECLDRSGGDSLVISVMAGITSRSIAERLNSRRVVRAMPNTPCLIGEGAIGVALGAVTDTATREWVMAILGSTGLVIEVGEAMLDAVTGLSGSGPAYVFRMIQAMASEGEALGLPAKDALKLAEQTVKGAASLLIHSNSSPQTLIEQVASPGGTTLRGLDALDCGGFDEVVRSAVREAACRASELSH